jgi:hypothetical protein
LQPLLLDWTLAYRGHSPGVAIFGSDDGAERIYMLYFDERGVSRTYDVTVGVKEMTCRRDHPKFSQATS